MKYYVPSYNGGDDVLRSKEELEKAYLEDGIVKESRIESEWEDDDFEEWLLEGLSFGWVVEVEE